MSTRRRSPEPTAGQAAVALPDARFAEGLAGEVEQRNAELAVINSIQRSMSERLDFQAIVDVVGDKLREVFASQNLFIALLEADTTRVRMVYIVEHGVRLVGQSVVANLERPFTRAIREGRTLVVRNATDQAALQMKVIAGTDRPTCGVYVPVMLGERYAGHGGLEGFEREDAFDAAAIRLLQTVTASMAVALENARLFDETQRLLKETEQRAAELALITTVQRALAGELSLQGVYDAVGMKLREVFPGFGVGIRRYDAQTGLMHFPFWWKEGERTLHAPAVPAAGFGAEVLRTKQTLLIDHDTEAEARRLGAAPLTRSAPAPKSHLVVPMFAGEQVVGMLDLNHLEREKAFSESDVRLLETIAASMSVALENARLFDETQRLLKETEQRNAELAVINSIQQGVGAELDFQAIVDLVGDKLREVFATGDLMITWRDEAAGVRRILYAYEHGARQDLGAVADTLARPIDRALLLRKPVIVRNPADAAALELFHFEGTDMSLSSVFVPMFSGDRFLGTIILENYEREDAFGE